MSQIHPDASIVAHQTSVVIDRFAVFCTGPHRLSDLEGVEQELDRWTQLHRDIWARVAPDGQWQDPTVQEHYEPLLRCTATSLALFQVLAQAVSGETGFNWGGHFTPTDIVALVDFDPIPDHLPKAAVLRLLPDLANDVLSALTEVVRYVPEYNSLARKDTEKRLREICEVIGCRPDLAVRLGEDWGFELKPADWAANELAVDVEELARRVADRQVLAVPLWNGTLGYPSFQFAPRAIRPDVAHVLANIDDRVDAWPVALWLAYGVRNDKSLPWYETKLAQRGLWKPTWNPEPTGSFDDVRIDRVPVAVSGPLYRVTSSRHGPFYFASVRPADGGTITPPSGRFDLDASVTEDGTLYTASTAIGACREVLDRELVLTLDGILRRSMWALEPQGDLEVADLTMLASELSATTNRPDTSMLATRLATRHRGIKVPLRTASNQTGVAFFGHRRCHLPGSTNLGIWSAERDTLARTEALWSYVEQREEDSSSFPVVFRRFPKAA